MNASFFDVGLDPALLWFPERASEDQRLLYASLRHFAEIDLAPHEAALERHDHATARALFGQCAALGVFAAELDEADGGLGFGVVESTLLCEALGRGHSLNVGLMVHQGVGMLPIACFGTQEQRAAWLPGAAAGERVMAFALTEPHCGSDALALATTAEPDGGAYRITGTKQFITNAAYADCFITFARIPGAGITAFLVDANTPGLSVGPEEKKLGQHASSTCSVFYDRVSVPAGNILGEVGKGHRIALTILNLGRLKLAAACVGKMKVLLPEGVTYVQARTAFGQPLSAFGMTRDRLARMAALCFATESAVYRVASLMERALDAARSEGAALGNAERLSILQDFALECALVKSFATESLGAFTDDLLQLYGGYGFSEEYPAAKAFRDARVTRLYEGTTEICRLTAVRRALALAAMTTLDETEIPAGDRVAVSAAKAAFGRYLKSLMAREGFDAEQFHRAQEQTGDLALALEAIYAVESGWLRCRAMPVETAAARDLVSYFESRLAAPAYAAFLPAPHKNGASVNMGADAPTRDRIVAALIESGGVLPGSL